MYIVESLQYLAIHSQLVIVIILNFQTDRLDKQCRLVDKKSDQGLHCLIFHLHYLSLVMRKPAFCICENNDADQLRGNLEADQSLCFRYSDSTIPLLSKYEISNL